MRLHSFLITFNFVKIPNPHSIKNDDGEPCVSYVAITMDENLDLNVYKNRGRPKKSDKIKTSRQIKREFAKLRKQMNYKKGTEILLALSLASDDMTRHVAMYPEVFYLDVTSNTNKQKRDLFLMIVKDANGHTFVGNVTIVPSGQRWVYAMIYKKIFIELYGEVTISRNRLALTDDDVAEWGPLDDCIASIKCWKNSQHMLCVFHAVTMQYFEKIHPKLPHRGKIGSKSRSLTKKGKQYGVFINYLHY